MHKCQTTPSLNQPHCLVAECRRVRKVCVSEHVPKLNALRVQYALLWRVGSLSASRPHRVGRTQRLVNVIYLFVSFLSPSCGEVLSRTAVLRSLWRVWPRNRYHPDQYYSKTVFVRSCPLCSLVHTWYEGKPLDFSILGVIGPGYPCDTNLHSTGHMPSPFCTSRGFSSFGVCRLRLLIVVSRSRPRVNLLGEICCYQVPCT